MFRFLVTLTVFNFLASTALMADVAEHRKVFHAAVLDREKVEPFNQIMRATVVDNPVTLAYLAVSEAMLAGVLWNPIEKYEQVKKYETLISKALDSEPYNLEIRFLRLCVEFHVPSWLGFENHLETDKSFIIQNLAAVDGMDFDPYFVRYIVVFIRDTGLCTSQESEQIDQILKMKSLKVVN